MPDSKRDRKAPKYFRNERTMCQLVNNQTFKNGEKPDINAANAALLKTRYVFCQCSDIE